MYGTNYSDISPAPITNGESLNYVTQKSSAAEQNSRETA